MAKLALASHEHRIANAECGSGMGTREQIVAVLYIDSSLDVFSLAMPCIVPVREQDEGRASSILDANYHRFSSHW